MFRNVKNKVLFLVPAALAGVIFAANARGASITNGNSSLTINTNGVPFISQWIVDGVDQYGGSPAGGESLLLDINGSSSFTTLDELTVTGSSFSDGVASVSYQGTGFTMTVTDILTGGNAGSGSSAVNEQVAVNNTSDSSISLDFTDNVNLNVDATPDDDTLTVTSNTATQTDPLGTTVQFVYTPSATSVAAGNHGNSGSLLDTSLPAVFTGDDAFDYNLSAELAPDGSPGDSAIFSLGETVTGATSGASVVPLPNSAGAALATLAGLGAIGIVRRARRAMV
ncbi:MAG TPA: hypothetical protein VHX86_11655 [Tepidisphaeraceae bacterium]|jgi:hypothetical protein|nr:hypothetical protein [Tepidisphaeraceae bacterium]